MKKWYWILVSRTGASKLTVDHKDVFYVTREKVSKGYDTYAECVTASLPYMENVTLTDGQFIRIEMR